MNINPLEKHIKYIHADAVHNLTSPNIIVPVLLELFKPLSIVDVGCGTGTFLKVFKDFGVKDVVGIDGKWVDKNKLHISLSEFVEADLEKPINLGKNFDLVLCLEVAEHLSEDSADVLIKSLTSLSNTIIFSAAIPNQGGQNHINEQEYSYWQEKFSLYGFRFVDVFRPRFWNEKNIDWWYKQNMFLVVHESTKIDESLLYNGINPEILTQVHPDLYNYKIKLHQELITELNYYKNGDISFWVYLDILIKKIKKKIFN